MNTEQRDALRGSEHMLSHGLPIPTEHYDTHLVQASQHGDQSAFALLVHRHQQRVFALSIRLLQDPEEANEATQEAFLAAWQGLSGFRGDVLFSSWLYRIAYHCCLRVLERRTREHLVQEAIQMEQARSEIGMEQQAMENIERHDQQVSLQKNLEQLPVTYRLVLHLRYLQDRTYEEIADILAMPLGAIKTSLFRAKRLLKSAWLHNNLKVRYNERCTSVEVHVSCLLMRQNISERRERYADTGTMHGLYDVADVAEHADVLPLWKCVL